VTVGATKTKTKKKSSMDTDSWCSPHAVADPLAQFFHGPVDFDPCSNPNSIIKARRALHAGGLHLPWKLKNPVDWSCYENYPYSKGLLWTPKSMYELIVGNVHELVRLVMVATSTRWWSQQCGVMPTVVKDRERLPRNPRILFTKRLKFIGDVGFGARFDTALVYYGDRNRQFEKEFHAITRWMAWGR
jgi:hypothetical protein